ncbi:energy coupling factor transporter S component ThiW [Convivina intestini]|uniref:Energy coupling factor transporter S component ThiW n=1 Tax=Convivina intestini TaxID=1505726 RepID=A0A2U1D428_9LACO|nr:energy coupling factor transporter S component ThiW [Convivina intestini]PVY82359.1 energy coupling factor transporter S component ThiW [Convivina intestini]CAH1854550.1 hypothetical protein R078131_00973 [Convivina intestini]CAH1857385.1 hypothetical protein R077811_01484 [Convivina intestini]SDC14743.1 energy coupling factor transporter S component ThiW [Leuconostocaceae bacterium R-53105]
MNKRVKKLAVVAVMIALDVVLTSVFRIEGMAPMSSVMNIIAAVLLGPVYAFLMALITAIIRIFLLGVPPLALTGAIFGAIGASFAYRYGQRMYWAMIGEFIGTGIIGSLLSYPLMVWYTGSQQALYWLVYTPRFIGATLIGAGIAYFVLKNLLNQQKIGLIQQLFK